jgi:hypothetical protein
MSLARRANLRQGAAMDWIMADTHLGRLKVNLAMACEPANGESRRFSLRADRPTSHQDKTWTLSDPSALT